MKIKGTLLLLVLVVLFSSVLFPAARHITIVAYSKTVPEGSGIFIIGQGVEIGNWTRTIEMKKVSASKWIIQLDADQGDTLKFKFNRGNWRSEAVDSNGVEYFNFLHVVRNDTTLIYNIPKWRDQLRNKIMITQQRLKNKSGYIELFEGWKYKLGDDTLWADPKLDDSSWKEVNNSLLNKADFDKMNWNWTGNIWFRTRLIIDSALINKPLGFTFYNSGAAEIYLDGNLLYRFGKINRSKDSTVNYFDRIPRTISFTKTEHIIAVRLTDFSAAENMSHGAPFGFFAMVGDMNTLVIDRIFQGREVSIHQLSFGAFLLAFSLIHFLLFVFYPKSKENLFYSIAMLAFSAVVYSGTQTYFATTVKATIILTIINSVSIQIALLFGLLTVYASSYRTLPRQYLAFVFLSSLFIIHTALLSPDLLEPYVDYAYYVFAIITTIEIFRVVIGSVIKKESQGWDWLVGFGVIIAILFITYQLLINFGILPPLFGINLIYVYGIVILAITMSVNLSKRISSTNKNLEKQLVQVKELSRIALEQERRAKDEEIARKLIEADNERKTKELEEARKLQYAMLPRKVPPIPEFDIAVYMKPATEVGGDYYDFKYDNEGNLIVAVGDATGHGMKAGTLVATIKGLFTAESFQTDILTFLNKCNHIIIDMQLGNLFMAMMVAKIHTNSGISMSFSSAGMPPALIYRTKTKAVEEHRILGLPLGGSFTQLGGYYSKKETSLNSGDMLLLMSDGFPELFNEEKEILDYDKAKEIFCRIAAENHSSAKVIDELLIEANKWMNGADQQDDITFVVIKVK